jgi:TM2 domain-containing membrane protein YozV
LRLQKGDIASAATSYGLAGRPEVASAIGATKEGPRRSPTTAAILSSFIPGSGEIYAGHTATGLLGFAITAGFLAGAVWAAKTDDWVSASIIVSTLFWRFYNGSRSNAVAFADDLNSASRRRRIARLAAELPEPDWFSGADSVLGYRVRPDTLAVDSMAGLR